MVFGVRIAVLSWVEAVQALGANVRPPSNPALADVAQVVVKTDGETWRLTTSATKCERICPTDTSMFLFVVAVECSSSRIALLTAASSTLVPV